MTVDDAVAKALDAYDAAVADARRKSTTNALALRIDPDELDDLLAEGDRMVAEQRRQIEATIRAEWTT